MLTFLLALVAPSLSALIPIILTLLVIGVCLWLIETKIPMDDTVKIVIRVVVVICAVLYLLKFAGIG